ncbi:PYLa/PGLa A-like [Xenopus tropicalis]|uniref:PYLa/PGLa A-like n=1 Tax=Xenopus tropicalis TaxID=8364 RepID=A0A8J1JQX1_XENTR|nr:PYLa/PGLa A-like [Xenopus tropicalis]
MYKGIFLCVFLAAICANALAQPTGFADADEESHERYIRGMATKAGTVLGKVTKAIIGAALGRRSARDLQDLIPGI